MKMSVSIIMLMFCIMMTAMMITMIMMIEAANMYTSIHTPCEFWGFSVFVSLIVTMMWALQVYILCVNSSGAFAAKTDDKAA